MNAIIVLLELEPATEVLDVGAGETDIGARVRVVHAARTDPGAPGGSPSRTLCALGVDDLEPEPYTPAGPDVPWCPPARHSRHCLDCDAALHPG